MTDRQETYHARHALDPIIQEVIDEGEDYRYPIRSSDYPYLKDFLDSSQNYGHTPRQIGHDYAKTAIVLELDELQVTGGLVNAILMRLREQSTV
jgi:hypothetical protein